MKRFVAGAIVLLSAAPATAETTAWGGVGANINTVAANLGLDTSLGEKGFIGLSGRYEDGGAKDCETVNSVKYCWKSGRALSGELRLGMKTSGGSKLYALTGYGNATFKPSASNSTTTISGRSYKVNGFTVGAGFEWAAGKNVFLRTDLRYSDYQEGFSTLSVMPTIGLKF